VVQAIESEAIQGQVAERVVTTTKRLVTAAGLNIESLALQMPPGRVAAVKKYFV
jgi:hypothetical protein